MPPLIPTICASCAELLVSPAITEPHTHMALQHKQVRGADNYHEGKYICIECNSTWILHFEDQRLVDARLIDNQKPRTNGLTTDCPRPYHATSRPALCQAAQRPRKGTRSI